MTRYAPLKTWVNVNSSNVQKIWYDAEQEILLIQFLAKGKQRARRYSYRGVPITLWIDFINAPSKGQFVWKRIRDKFVYTEL